MAEPANASHDGVFDRRVSILQVAHRKLRVLAVNDRRRIHHFPGPHRAYARSEQVRLRANRGSSFNLTQQWRLVGTRIIDVTVILKLTVDRLLTILRRVEVFRVKLRSNLLQAEVARIAGLRAKHEYLLGGDGTRHRVVRKVVDCLRHLTVAQLAFAVIHEALRRFQLRRLIVLYVWVVKLERPQNGLGTLLHEHALFKV